MSSKVQCWLIQSPYGQSMGIWCGPSTKEAILSMHRHRGFSEDHVWIEDGEIKYKDRDWMDFIGEESQWKLIPFSKRGSGLDPKQGSQKTKDWSKGDK